MLIDLHTHSRRSDGTDSPSELVANAKEAGLDVVALTDHDSMQGWDEASVAAGEHDLELVRGLEISCVLHGSGVHLLAYEPDRTNVPLLEELERVLTGRNDRLPQTLRRLHDIGIDLTIADVLAVSGDAVATGRPHVADALIVKGVVASRDEAFERYLMPGRPAYVNRYAADLQHMIGLIVDAGGAAVIAHPWSRGSWRVLDPAVFGELRDIGLRGMEVDHQDHSSEKRARLREIAADLDLIATGSSDYHGAGKIGFPLGCNTTDPAAYERLRATWA